MKKNYFKPMAKVVSMNCNYSVMEPGLNQTSDVSQNKYSDAPLF